MTTAKAYHIILLNKARVVFEGSYTSNFIRLWAIDLLS